MSETITQQRRHASVFETITTCGWVSYIGLRTETWSHVRNHRPECVQCVRSRTYSLVRGLASMFETIDGHKRSDYVLVHFFVSQDIGSCFRVRDHARAHAQCVCSRTPFRERGIRDMFLCSRTLLSNEDMIRCPRLMTGESAVLLVLGHLFMYATMIVQ